MAGASNHIPGAPTVRLARDSDVLPIAKVHITSWRETYLGILPKHMLTRLSIAGEAIRWQRMFDRPDAANQSLVFVADQDGAILGYGSCGEQRTELLHDRGFTAEVGELYVLGCAQHRGVGSKLMRAMAAALVGLGHAAMSLWVLEQNSPARDFYERIGGRLVAAKQGGVGEVAYGWSDLRQLAKPAD